MRFKRVPSVMWSLTFFMAFSHSYQNAAGRNNVPDGCLVRLSVIKANPPNPHLLRRESLGLFIKFICGHCHIRHTGRFPNEGFLEHRFVKNCSCHSSLIRQLNGMRKLRTGIISRLGFCKRKRCDSEGVKIAWFINTSFKRLSHVPHRSCVPGLHHF